MSINSWTCHSEVMCLLIRGHVRVSDMSINSWTCQSEVMSILICGQVRVK